MIIYTLFEQVDFSGKTLIPFNTHMGSGDRLGYVQLLRRSCLGAFLRKSGQDFQQTHFDHTIISPDSLFGLLSSWILQNPLHPQIWNDPRRNCHHRQSARSIVCTGNKG